MSLGVGAEGLSLPGGNSCLSLGAVQHQKSKKQQLKGIFFLIYITQETVNYASVIDHKGQLVANQCAVLISLIYKQLILFVEQGRTICWGISCSRVFEKSLQGSQTRESKLMGQRHFILYIYIQSSSQ